MQVRDKTATDAAFVRLAQSVREVLRPTGVPMLLDDRVHLVACTGAEGVHVGQSDTVPTAARQLLGPSAVIGLSTHTVAEVEAANALPDGTLDYLGMGPVWATPTKKAHATPIGPDGLAAMRAASHLPAVAIGSVTAQSLADLRPSGVEGVAVVRALCAAEDVAGAARALRGAWA